MPCERVNRSGKSNNTSPIRAAVLSCWYLPGTEHGIPWTPSQWTDDLRHRLQLSYPVRNEKVKSVTSRQTARGAKQLTVTVFENLGFKQAIEPGLGIG